MEYLDTNAELKRQVTTLQKYLMQVVEHSEMEVQDHEINERIWRKEKMQLKAQIKILKNGGTIEDMDDDDGNLLENFDVNNSSMAVSHSELESSIINLTSERDSLKETVHMLSAKLGIEPNVINNNTIPLIKRHGIIYGPMKKIEKDHQMVMMNKIKMIK